MSEVTQKERSYVRREARLEPKQRIIRTREKGEEQELRTDEKKGQQGSKVTRKGRITKAKRRDSFRSECE